MAKAFDTWTVLPHDPLRKHSENLWSVEGTMPDGNNRRVMTLARLSDGRLLIHNAVALEEPLMAELEQLGTPSILVVPNGYHRMDARIYKSRYPSLVVLCPAAHQKRVEQVVKVDGTYDDAPKDADVRLQHLDGSKQNEGVLEVRSKDGATLVFNDAINNLPKMGGVLGFVLAPTGKPCVPRLARFLIVKDRAAFRSHLERLAGTEGLRRVIVSHGKVVEESAPQVLRDVAAQLS